jgi:hypothetical protein
MSTHNGALTCLLGVYSKAYDFTRVFPIEDSFSYEKKREFLRLVVTNLKSTG